MTYKEKLVWLRKIFSNDPRVRAEAMSAEIPQPLFESQEDFAKALEDLENGQLLEGQAEGKFRA